MNTPPNTPRIPPLPEAEWTGEARELLAAQGKKPLNIFTTLARHPKLLKRWMVFAAHVMAKNSIPVRERELVILRTGFRCNSKYEFHQHTRIALASGVTAAEIERTRQDVSAWSGPDALLMRATDELVSDKCISDSTWSALAVQCSETQLFDLIFTVGQYTLVSMALNTLGIQIEERP